MIALPLAVLAACYCLLCGCLFLGQERLIFLPTRLPPDYRFPFREPFEELSLPSGGETLSALLFKADRPRGAVLYLHGNGGCLAEWGSVVPPFLASGYDVLVIDYRGYGKSTGAIRSEADLLQDGEAGYAELARRRPEGEIVVLGRSLGSGVAAWLARAHHPRLLILESPYFSLRDLAGRSVPFVPRFLLKYQLRTDLWIGEAACPVVLIHGTQDEVIPHESSVRLLPLIRSPHELVSVEGAGHNDLDEFPESRRALARILAE